MYQIESLLSARLFLRPQKVGNRIFFESNLSGHISLYAMNYGGSVPEPLLPPDIALHNPHLLDGKTFFVYLRLGKIIVMIDQDGDENYQPMAIPIEGGYPQPTFDNFFVGHRVHIDRCDSDRNLLYLVAESRQEPRVFTYQGNLDTGELILLGESPFGLYPEGISSNLSKIALREDYTLGDNVVYIGSTERDQVELIYGVPMDQRALGQSVPLNYISSTIFTPGDRGLLFVTALFEDTRGLGYLNLDEPRRVLQVRLEGISHHGVGELEELEHLKDNRYLLTFNIDGCSWLYEGSFDEDHLVMSLEHVICGMGHISSGVLEHVYYDEDNDCFSLAFSTATTPTQIYTVEGLDRNTVVRHTNERILAIPAECLSPGEDVSFTSFDGTRISSRLYLPSPLLGYEGPRPIVYYVHGGPQGQERPDFAWFSMPLIQFLTLKGFAVFVPNVRGSTGYGQDYTKRVDRDWGGKDRLDHVHAMTQILPKDKRLDVKRAGAVRRSYGRYTTLTLAAS